MEQRNSGDRAGVEEAPKAVLRPSDQSDTSEVQEPRSDDGTLPPGTTWYPFAAREPNGYGLCPDPRNPEGQVRNTGLSEQGPLGVGSLGRCHGRTDAGTRPPWPLGSMDRKFRPRHFRTLDRFDNQTASLILNQRIGLRAKHRQPPGCYRGGSASNSGMTLPMADP